MEVCSLFSLLSLILALVGLTSSNKENTLNIQLARQIDPLSIVAFICFAFVVIGAFLTLLAVIGRWFEVASGHLRIVNINRFKKLIMGLLGVIIMLIFILPGVAIYALHMQPMLDSNSQQFTLSQDSTARDTPTTSPITQSQPSSATIAAPPLTPMPTPLPPTLTPTQHSIFIPVITNETRDE